MEASAQPAPVSTKKLWAGIVISALPALFLLFDGVMKLVKPPIVVETTVQLGYPESVILGLGIVLTVCTVIYVIPRTSVLGAILLTGYLGGAVATHLRIGDPLAYGIWKRGGVCGRCVEERQRPCVSRIDVSCGL
jgi:hypothetical protein